jgi:hypothetical protein
MIDHVGAAYSDYNKEIITLTRKAFWVNIDVCQMDHKLITYAI